MQLSILEALLMTALYLKRKRASIYLTLAAYSACVQRVKTQRQGEKAAYSACVQRVKTQRQGEKAAYSACVQRVKTVAFRDRDKERRTRSIFYAFVLSCMRNDHAA